MRKKQIPRIPPKVDTETRVFMEAVKENLEVVIGHRGSVIAPLPATSSADEVLAKVNEIIARLQ